MLNKAQKKIISNIFRDVTKLTVMALVLGQFVPGHIFDLAVFFGGLGAAILMACASIIFAVDEKEGDN